MVDMADKVNPAAGDPTQPFEAVPGGERPDGTARDPDATAAHRPIDETRLDATPVHGDGPATAPLGGAPARGTAADEARRWSARASVRPGGPAPATQTEEWERDPYQGRSWFTPILIALID